MFLLLIKFVYYNAQNISTSKKLLKIEEEYYLYMSLQEKENLCWKLKSADKLAKNQDNQ